MPSKKRNSYKIFYRTIGTKAWEPYSGEFPEESNSVESVMDHLVDMLSRAKFKQYTAKFLKDKEFGVFHYEKKWILKKTVQPMKVKMRIAGK